MKQGNKEDGHFNPPFLFRIIIKKKEIDNMILVNNYFEFQVLILHLYKSGRRFCFKLKI